MAERNPIIERALKQGSRSGKPIGDIKPVGGQDSNQDNSIKQYQAEFVHSRTGKPIESITETDTERTFNLAGGEKYTVPANPQTQKELTSFSGRTKFGGTPSQERPYINKPQYEGMPIEQGLMLAVESPTASTGFKSLAQQRLAENQLYVFGNIPEKGSSIKRYADLTPQEKNLIFYENTHYAESELLRHRTTIMIDNEIKPPQNIKEVPGWFKAAVISPVLSPFQESFQEMKDYQPKYNGLPGFFETWINPEAIPKTKLLGAELAATYFGLKGLYSIGVLAEAETVSRMPVRTILGITAFEELKFLFSGKSPTESGVLADVLIFKGTELGFRVVKRTGTYAKENMLDFKESYLENINPKPLNQNSFILVGKKGVIYSPPNEEIFAVSQSGKNAKLPEFFPKSIVQKINSPISYSENLNYKDMFGESFNIPNVIGETKSDIPLSKPYVNPRETQLQFKFPSSEIENPIDIRATAIQRVRSRYRNINFIQPESLAIETGIEIFKDFGDIVKDSFRDTLRPSYEVAGQFGLFNFLDYREDKETRFMPITRQKYSIIQKQNQFNIPGIAQITPPRIDLSNPQKISQAQMQRQSQIMITDLEFEWPTPTPEFPELEAPPREETPFFGSWGLDLFSGKKRKGRMPGLKYMYMPSVAGLSENIRIKSIPNFLTGIEVRGFL